MYGENFRHACAAESESGSAKATLIVCLHVTGTEKESGVPLPQMNSAVLSMETCLGQRRKRRCVCVCVKEQVCEYMRACVCFFLSLWRRGLEQRRCVSILERACVFTSSLLSLCLSALTCMCLAQRDEKSCILRNPLFRLSLND